MMLKMTKAPSTSTKISSQALSPSALMIMLPEKGEKYKKASQGEGQQEDGSGGRNKEFKRKRLDQQRISRKLPISLREEELMEDGESSVERKNAGNTNNRYEDNCA